MVAPGQQYGFGDAVDAWQARASLDTEVAVRAASTTQELASWVMEGEGSVNWGKVKEEQGWHAARCEDSDTHA